MQWAIHYLTHDAPACIEGENGDNTMLKVCGQLKDHGISEEQAFHLLAEYYNHIPEWPGEPGCDPPWRTDDDAPTKDKLETKVRNAFAYLRKNAPGSKSAAHEFSTDPLPPETDAEMAERLRRTKERRERKEAQPKRETWGSLLSGWCYVGQQRRFVRKADAMRWEVPAFNDYFANLKPQDKPSGTSISKWIFTRDDGVFDMYDTFAYLPGRPPRVGNAYNLYVPSSIEPVAGDTSIWDEHLLYLFPDPVIRDHVLNWLAWVLQNLGLKPKHALVLLGLIQGTGKSWIADVFSELIGRRNVWPLDQMTLERAHNGWAMETKLAVCEEVRASYPPNAVVRVLHPMITQQWLNIDEKNMPPLRIPDVMAYLLMTNKDNALPMDDSDRRYLVCETMATPRDKAYYCRLYDVLDDPAALGAIMHQLLNRDLKSYTAQGQAPATEAKQAMIENSANEVQRWMIENGGRPPLSYRLATVEDIIDALPRRMHRPNVDATVINVLKWKFGAARIKNQVRVSGERLRLWALNRFTPKPNDDLAAIYLAERGPAHARGNAADFDAA